MDSVNIVNNILYKWKHQVEHHPSKTSNFLLLLFLEVVKVFGELNLVDEQHIGGHEKYSFFDQ
jgi:hypothetical protein